MTDHAPGRDWRRAYREAWATRVTTGDTSEVVLLRRLHLHCIFLDPAESGALEILLGLWRRGVSPSRLP